MPDDISLKSFTSIDTVADPDAYVRALEAFDAIEQLQELKRIERAGVPAGASVLDVGCGFGLETLRLAEQVGPGGTAAGIDESADFIAEARRRAAARGLAVDFREGDALALPYAGAAFDHVRAERLLIYLPEPDRALAGMRDVLKPGGSLALIEPEFDSLTINLPNRAAVRRAMASEADTAVAQSQLPGRLGEMLADLGMRDISIATRVLIFPQDLAAAYFAGAGRNAHARGALSDEELDAWLAGIEAMHGQGRLFGTIGYFLFTARRLA